MKNSKQNIILFKPSDYPHRRPTNIGNLFMNRFAIDEDEASEISLIHKLETEQNQSFTSAVMLIPSKMARSGERSVN